MPMTQIATATSAGSWTRATSAGVAAARIASGTEDPSDGDHRPTTKARTDASNIRGSRSPARCASTTGAITATDRASSGVLGTKAQRAKAATGTAASKTSTGDEGWVIAATKATASATIGTRRRRASVSNQPWPEPSVTSGL